MNKKGFISTSVVYSFFLVFIAIVLSIIAAYSSRRMLLLEIKEDIRNVIDSKTTYDCYSKGITNLKDCIIDTYGGIDAIELQDAPDFSKVTADGEYGLYATEDDYGTSYYFRGDVENNYIQFGQNDSGVDMYWRIIRINGDGSIRLIYDGTELVENGVTHTATIGATAYNTNSDNAKYVGYTYDDGTGVQVDSTIKEKVDAWYTENLEDYYANYLADSIFCNDRQLTNGKFASYDRLFISQNPTLKCTNKSDRYTVDNIESGNGYLSKPIGLITADEAMMAGGIIGTINQPYYLYLNELFWTLTPMMEFDMSMWAIGQGSMYYDYYVNESLYVRPVINLKADIKIKKGNGTISSPYVVEEVGY